MWNGKRGRQLMTEEPISTFNTSRFTVKKKNNNPVFIFKKPQVSTAPLSFISRVFVLSRIVFVSFIEFTFFISLFKFISFLAFASHFAFVLAKYQNASSARL
jgi:hypothetical protein